MRPSQWWEQLTGGGPLRSRAAFAVAGVALVAVLGGGVATFALQRGAGSTTVLLERAGTVGPLPFLELLGRPVPTLRPEFQLIADVGGGGEVPGDRPGLYGGTGGDQGCDRDQLVSFLEGNPDHAAAWAAVHGIEPSGIAAYVADLTPVALVHDIRVTNHGYADGRATPRQSVLEAGTWVLVDRFGVPRVRCACGNPLLEPTHVDEPRYEGDRWDGFDEGSLLAITPADAQQHLVIVDLATGDLVERPIGTAGEADRPLEDEDVVAGGEPPPTGEGGSGPTTTATQGDGGSTGGDGERPGSGGRRPGGGTGTSTSTSTSSSTTTSSTTTSTSTTSTSTTTSTVRPEVGECGDGHDNDGDGLADGRDPSCGDGTEAPRDPLPECGDGRDNDDDGYTDLRDPSCGDGSEEPRDPLPECGDGEDNDGDGYTDRRDPSCGDGTEEPVDGLETETETEYGTETEYHDGYTEG